MNRSGAPKKARWSTAKKVDARRASSTHRGQGDRDDRPQREGVVRKPRFDRDDRPRREGGYEGPRREFSDRPRREGGYDRPQRDGGFDRRPRFERDDRPRREGGYDRPQRDGGFDRKPRFERDDRPRRDGGYAGPRREFSDRPRREGGYDRPQRDGGFDRKPRFERDDRPRREGGYDRPQRDGGFDRKPRFDRDDRPRREGGYDRPQRDGGFDRKPRFDRDDRPRREGGYDRPQHGGGFDRKPRFDRDDRPRREGGYDRKPRFDRDDRPRREGGYDRKPRFDRDDRPRRNRFDAEQPGALHDERSRSWSDKEERQAMGLAVDLPAEHAAAEVTEDNGFQALGLPDALVERLARDGITTPFPIQVATIPDALAGRDVLGRGQTGSGKTLSFGLPLITRLAAGGHARPGQVRSIILVPTRELAQQVSDALQPLVHVMGLRHKLVAGGMPYPPQIAALEKGLDVLVATPGRLKDLIDRGAADLSHVEVAVLDEADHMAEMGFLEAISEVLDLIPAGGQRLLFSATLDRGIDTVVERYLVDPVTHETDPGTASVDTMDHHILLIDPMHKKVITAEVANRTGRTVVFVRTKLGADRVALQLREQGVFAAALHGGLSQVQRNRVLTGFKDGTLPVLVATDVAARGIHVDDVSVVLQVDPPADHKDYLHRSGRTARAGERGTVVTLALPHQRRQMERLVEQAGVDVTPVRMAPGDQRLYDGVGARTPSGEAVDEGRYRRLIEGEPRPSRGGFRRSGSRYQPVGRRNDRAFRSNDRDRGRGNDRDRGRGNDRDRGDYRGNRRTEG
ncbi:DEAD/DEAH box helicase [Arsenicicoccus dermatophilus]